MQQSLYLTDAFKRDLSTSHQSPSHLSTDTGGPGTPKVGPCIADLQEASRPGQELTHNTPFAGHFSVFLAITSQPIIYSGY